MSAVRPKKYQCYEPGCTKAYTQAHNLKSHRDSAHLVLKPYRCNPCASDFARKSDFEIHHQARHCDQFSCAVRIGSDPGSSICGKQFTRRTKLKKHQLKAHGLTLLDVTHTRASGASHEPASDGIAAPTVTRAQSIPLSATAVTAATAATAAADGMGDDQDMILDVLYDEMSGSNPLVSFCYLLQRLPDVNARGNARQTLAHSAARNDNSNFIKACIACGANLTLEDDWGETPLHEACVYLRSTNIALILGSATNPSHKDNRLTFHMTTKDIPLLRMLERLIDFHGGGPMPNGVRLVDFQHTLAILSDHGITKLRLLYSGDLTLRRPAVWLDSSGMHASNGFQIVQQSRESKPLEFRFTSDLTVPRGYGVAIQS